jgi:hypothetical protein
MTDQGPRGGGEEHHWPDRDTEPIPRARNDAEPGRHAAEPRDADPDDPGGPGDPVAERDDPFLDEPTPFVDATGRGPARAGARTAIPATGSTTRRPRTVRSTTTS